MISKCKYLGNYPVLGHLFVQCKCFGKICVLCFISWSNDTQIHNTYPSRITNGRHFFVNCSLTILMLVYIRLNLCTVYANSFTFHEWGLLKPSYNTSIPHRLIFIHITLNMMSTLSRLISSHLKSSHFFFIISATFPQQLKVAQICAFPPLRRKQCFSLPTPLLFNVLN